MRNEPELELELELELAARAVAQAGRSPSTVASPMAQKIWDVTQIWDVTRPHHLHPMATAMEAAATLAQDLSHVAEPSSPSSSRYALVTVLEPGTTSDFVKDEWQPQERSNPSMSSPYYPSVAAKALIHGAARQPRNVLSSWRPSPGRSPDR